MLSSLTVISQLFGLTRLPNNETPKTTMPIIIMMIEQTSSVAIPAKTKPTLVPP